MARNNSLFILSGTLAVLLTIIGVGLQIAVSVRLDHEQRPIPKRAAAVAATFEFVVLAVLVWLGVSRLFWPNKTLSGRRLIIALASQVGSCTLGAAASAASLASLSNSAAGDAANAELAAWESSMLAGSGVILALAIISQLSFLVVHFVSSRGPLSGSSSDADAESHRNPNTRVKGIRYSQTSPTGTKQAPDEVYVERKSSSPSTATKSTRGTIRSTVSHAIRPSSSTKRLLSLREKSRLASPESAPRRRSADNSFDSWDTSSVDTHNRQVVLEMSSPTIKAPGGLETIPASPTAAYMLDGQEAPLEPPPTLRRSRSYSASTLSQMEEARNSDSSELHIHPLFRSDSPTPPPLAMPGTSVVAAPQAGQVITRRESRQSLKRMRSSSLQTGRSPLSRQTSLENARLGRQSALPEEVEAANPGRKMTPPVPEWLLNPGMQASLPVTAGGGEAER
ncbi:hypothetical protein JDV02_000949 [Purpureocillium takamizusanense]|uniref:Uncharacterized protein n=1 Tax=Purpureocillium takamizusanense TaxID=2060973 RepID=A0A9Q8Q8A9_9HYPO|nr:uncharacterized protein JDV02_000949 [Purpureocillium takamizusanense]UNI14308.1 hypothetical protein JDV02_000949 [Purpureocillium takamizusanense]